MKSATWGEKEEDEQILKPARIMESRQADAAGGGDEDGNGRRTTSAEVDEINTGRDKHPSGWWGG